MRALKCPAVDVYCQHLLQPAAEYNVVGRLQANDIGSNHIRDQVASQGQSIVDAVGSYVMVDDGYGPEPLDGRFRDDLIDGRL